MGAIESSVSVEYLVSSGSGGGDVTVPDGCGGDEGDLGRADPGPEVDVLSDFYLFEFLLSIQIEDLDEKLDWGFC